MLSVIYNVLVIYSHLNDHYALYYGFVCPGGRVGKLKVQCTEPHFRFSCALLFYLAISTTFL